jgi:predicted nucleotidyltransferase
MQPPTVSSELKDLASLLADWAAPASGVTVYLFGSRVRGDHKPASDIDLCIKWGDGLTDSDVQWHVTNEETDYAAIKRKLPGPLKILERDDPWYARALAAKVVYQDRSVRLRVASTEIKPPRSRG